MKFTVHRETSEQRTVEAEEMWVDYTGSTHGPTLCFGKRAVYDANGNVVGNDEYVALFYPGKWEFVEKKV